MQLVCVDPLRVREFWPHVRELILAAMRRGDLSSFGPVEASVLNGDALLWLAWDGEEVQAAAITELAETEWRKVCVVVACGSASALRAAADKGLVLRSAEREGGWLPLLEEIEAYARAAGCAAVRIVGRKGWARVLRRYKTKRIILEKDL